MTNKEAMVLFAEMIMNEQDVVWAKCNKSNVAISKYDIAANILANEKMNVKWIQDFTTENGDLFQGYSLKEMEV